MKDRILEFLRAENKSSSQFAEEIGVQPSGVSHILSGRNNPSLDFVLKMLGKYKYLSTEWLLFGKGAMYRDNSGMQSLFDQGLFDNAGLQGKDKQRENEPSETPEISPVAEKNVFAPKESIVAVQKIVWFYADGSFEEYYPRS